MSATTPPGTKTVLLLVDVQQHHVTGSPVDDAEAVLARIVRLHHAAHLGGTAVVLTRRHGEAGAGDERGAPGWNLHPGLRIRAGDLLVERDALDAFEGTDLVGQLARYGAGELVVVGFRSDGAVEATCTRALAAGYDVTLVSDAHATVDADGRTRAAVDEALAEAGALVVDVEVAIGHLR